MQQKLPCDVCGQLPISSTIVGYHRWYNGQTRFGYKQRLCFKCAQVLYDTYMKAARTEGDESTPWPATCPLCGEGLGEDTDMTWTTWFRGKNRKDTCLPLCVHCAANVRTVMMDRAVSLEERPQESRAGGAPLPTLAATAARDDLPW